MLHFYQRNLFSAENEVRYKCSNQFSKDGKGEKMRERENGCWKRRDFIKGSLVGLVGLSALKSFGIPSLDSF
jgi:hypothetical protein